MPSQRRPSPMPAAASMQDESARENSSNNLTQPMLRSSSRSSSRSTRNSQAKRRPEKRQLHRHFTLQYHIRLIARQAPKLLSFLFHGTPRWLLKLVRLLSFVFALMPGFLVFAYYYFWSADRIALPYKAAEDGRTSRHFLDVYGSRTRRTGGGGGTLRRDSSTTSDDGSSTEDEEGGKPVVVFLTGGAWIIGYKMWGALLARALVPHGVLVVIPDYRNFPQVRVAEMVQDVDASIQWTLDQCEAYGGDPSRVVVVGQSAGAHLGSCVLLRKAIDELKTRGRQHMSISSSASSAPPSSSLSTTYKAIDVKGFMAASGPYNVVAMQDIFHKHGLDRNIVSAMFGNNLNRHSPTHLVEECQNLVATQIRDNTTGNNDENIHLLGKILPPFCIVHGTADKTVPYAGAIEYASCLSDAGIRVVSKSYQDWSHTDPIIEAPMVGDHIFHRDVYDFVRQCTGTGTERDGDGGNGAMMPFDETLPACKPICLGPLVSLGRFCNPF